jgi:hypothetical protein
LVPLLKEEPIGVDRLMQLAGHSSATTFTSKEI